MKLRSALIVLGVAAGASFTVSHVLGIDASGVREAAGRAAGALDLIEQLQNAGLSGGLGGGPAGGGAGPGSPETAAGLGGLLGQLAGVGPQADAAEPVPPPSRLTATMRTPAGWVAVVDGEVARVGDRVEGGRLSEITDSGVVIEAPGGVRTSLGLGGPPRAG